ncbi:hypothetical protein F2Q70_00011934 [Brassica cretica]|uniref:Uncharacterized protein n=1 Tax=Brassica cretica TaxID=69181 RepID=A0A8S9LV80_BRACR|nr:hypothetical protein F2Q70_00011934 [Brassica cretica]
MGQQVKWLQTMKAPTLSGTMVSGATTTETMSVGSDPLGATPSSRSDLPYQSDLTRVTRRSRSRFHRTETRKRARSDVSQRPLQADPEAWNDLSE